MTDGTSGRVVVVGSINVDLFARVERHPRPGETVLGRDGSTQPGGKGANQAVAAALTGASTVMVGAVGDDASAEVGLSLLRRAGVDVEHVRVVEGVPTGTALITVAESGENSIIVIAGANHEVTTDDARAVALTDADVLVVQCEIPLDVVDEAVRRARDAGARVLVNLAPVVPLDPETLRAADPLVVNEHEARAAAGILDIDPTAQHPAPQTAGAPRRPHDDADADVSIDSRSDPGSPEPELTPESAGDLGVALVAAGVGSVVITLGGEGAVVVEAGRDPVVAPAETVDVVDTTGAGDCFAGTLAARLVAGDDLVAAARAGNVAAAHAVQGEGAQASYF